MTDDDAPTGATGSVPWPTVRMSMDRVSLDETGR